jgi:hypothetical protein
MKRNFTLLSVFFAIALFTQSQNATFNGSMSGGGATGSDRAADVVTDLSGNVFTANTFLLQATFNGVTFNGAAKGSGASYDNNLLVTKLNASKVTLWSIYSSDGAVNPTGLATTANGDLIITGNVRAVLNIAGQTTTANIIDAAGTITTFSGLGSATANVQSFVAKFNSNGLIQWVKEFNSNAAKSFSVLTDALVVDDVNDIYLTGNFTSNVIFPGAGQVTLTTANTTKSAFIVKLDGTTGDMIWHKESTGNILSEIIPALTFGDDGYIYAAGDFQNNATPTTPTQSITIGGKTFTPSVGADLTLIKLAKDGTIEYIQQRPSIYVSAIKSVRTKDIVVKNGKVFVSGSFNGNVGGIQFSDGALTCTSASLNGFIAAFNSTDGTDVWHKAILSPSIVEVNALTIGNDGNLFGFGYHYNKLSSNPAGDVDFGNGKLLTDATNASGDIFLASFLPTTGVTQEVHLVCKGTGSETGNSICSFGDKLYMVGSFNSGTLTFENSSTTAPVAANFDFYLVDYKVVNPIDGFSTTETSLAPYAFLDNKNSLVIIKNSEYLSSVKLFDITGRSIKTLSNNTLSLNIDTRGMLSGVYLLQMTGKNGNTTTQRILIK